MRILQGGIIMSESINKEIHLANRPSGMPSQSDFNFIDTTIPTPNKNEVLVRTLYLSVDPYMRGRMNDAKSYIPPFNLNEVISGGIVAEVVESNIPEFEQGDIVTGNLDWALYSLANEDTIRKVDPAVAPISSHLGILGMPGLTAYFGLLDIGKPKENETVVVSGASGAVGSAVGQIAKIKGAKVVGIAGSAEKVNYLLDELRFDAAVNYKDDTFKEDLKNALPEGVDVYYDNVGGEISDEVMKYLNRNSRVPVCGAISAYNLETPDLGPRIQGLLIKNSVLMQGFTVGNYAEDFQTAASDLGKWLSEGNLKYEETIVNGFENTIDAFLGLFEGTNIGKQIVKVAEPKYAK